MVVIRSIQAQCCRLVDTMPEAIKMVEKSNGNLFIDFDSDIIVCGGICKECPSKPCLLMKDINDKEDNVEQCINLGGQLEALSDSCTVGMKLRGCPGCCVKCHGEHRCNNIEEPNKCLLPITK